MGEAPPNGGYVRWTQLQDHAREETKARHDATERVLLAIAEVRADVRRDLDKRDASAAAYERRIDVVESLLDQQRGAATMMRLVLGSSVIAAAGALLALLRSLA